MPTQDNRNAICRNWAKSTRKELVEEMNKLGVKHRNNSQSPRAAQAALKQGVGQRQGTINRIRFTFPRHMVFVHKGAGKGYGGHKGGSEWMGAKGGVRRTNPASYGKMGTGKRKAKEWYNPVVASEIEHLADDLAK